MGYSEQLIELVRCTCASSRALISFSLSPVECCTNLFHCSSPLEPNYLSDRHGSLLQQIGSVCDMARHCRTRSYLPWSEPLPNVTIPRRLINLSLLTQPRHIGF